MGSGSCTPAVVFGSLDTAAIDSGGGGGEEGVGRGGRGGCAACGGGSLRMWVSKGFQCTVTTSTTRSHNKIRSVSEGAVTHVKDSI